MTRQQAIREEIHRYLAACVLAVEWRHYPRRAAQARHLAHIHVLALGRLRGQTVAAWTDDIDLSSCGGLT